MASFQPASLCRRRFKTKPDVLIRKITRTASSVLEGPQGLRPWKQTPTLIADTQQHRLATVSQQFELKALTEQPLAKGQRLLTQLR